MNVETIAEQLFFVTVHLSATTAKGPRVGTGFVYAVETDNGTAHFLVTNKHVLAHATELHVTMIAAGSNGQPALGKGTRITIDGFSDNAWHGHPNDAIDIAVFPLSAVLNAMLGNGAPPFFKSIPAELAMTEDAAGTLDAIEEVLFVGYPNGLFDTASLLPIARKGWTATPPQVDYRGVPAFLIDASVFPGSSGSPVFIFNQGAYVTREGGITLGSGRLMLLGILAAVHVRAIEAAVTEPAAQQVATFQEPIDLGIVYKAMAIDECIDEFLAKAGLARTAKPISEPTAATPADEALQQSAAQ